MNFSFFKKKSNLSFIFNIRDTSVSLAAVKFEKGEKPNLVLAQNFPIISSDTKSPDVHLSGMLKTLDSAVTSFKKSLIKMGNTEKPNQYFFFLGSLWSVSQSKIIKVEKDK